ncbi:MAG TPA: iron-containing alcohol dehydrogenase [Sphaerochaeta sp.]|jgi:alcohol dehydrogenase class IV|nr:iron-containing alcohol dehydrogenase [Sphaerochaeta sp.]
MIESLQSPVRIISCQSLSADALHEMLCYLVGSVDAITVGIITDDAPVTAKQTLLEELSTTLNIHIFDRVQPNPQSADIMRMYRDPRFAACDLLIGIGGGSVLDSAKALAMLASNGGELDSYLGNAPTLKVEKASMPLVLIPTTAGTGSEVTRVGVYTDGSGRKHTLGSPLMYARLAILDASMLDSVPPALCAATGLDALDHALESIWSKNSTPITRMIARKAAIEVLETLPKLHEAIVTKKKDRRALQERMLIASTKAAIAFNLTGTAAGHAISFILSEEWHVPHGLGCAFTLLEIFDWAQGDTAVRSELAKIAASLDTNLVDEESQVAALRRAIVTLMDTLSIPRTFADLGVNLGDVGVFARSMEDPKLHNQLPPLGKEQLFAIIEGKR